MRPSLVVTVDTEEEGLWSGRFPPRGQTCRNIARLPRLGAVFRRLGVRPTWLVDHPVAIDPTATSILRELVADEGGEIGAHLHPWCNPPLYPDGERARFSYPHQLAPAQQTAKLTVLCDAIERSFGARPTSYRAGRWGLDHTSVPVLEQLGFVVDSSVHTLWWERAPGAPNHGGAPQVPYRLAREDACRPGLSRVTEVPANHLFVGRHGRAVEPLFRRAPALPGMRWMMVQLGLRSLSPEEEPLAELRRTADAMAERALPVFNIPFHSSSALPGATPYVRSEAELDRFVDRLEALLEHVLGRYQALPLPLSAVPAHLGAAVLTAEHEGRA